MDTRRSWVEARSLGRINLGRAVARRFELDYSALDSTSRLQIANVRCGATARLQRERRRRTAAGQAVKILLWSDRQRLESSRVESGRPAWPAAQTGQAALAGNPSGGRKRMAIPKSVCSGLLNGVGTSGARRMGLAGGSQFSNSVATRCTAGSRWLRQCWWTASTITARSVMCARDWD